MRLKLAAIAGSLLLFSGACHASGVSRWRLLVRTKVIVPGRVARLKQDIGYWQDVAPRPIRLPTKEIVERVGKIGEVRRFLGALGAHAEDVGQVSRHPLFGGRILVRKEGAVGLDPARIGYQRGQTTPEALFARYGRTRFQQRAPVRAPASLLGEAPVVAFEQRPVAPDLPGFIASAGPTRRPSLMADVSADIPVLARQEPVLFEERPFVPPEAFSRRLSWFDPDIERSSPGLTGGYVTPQDDPDSPSLVSEASSFGRAARRWLAAEAYREDPHGHLSLLRRLRLKEELRGIEKKGVAGYRIWGFEPAGSIRGLTSEQSVEYFKRFLQEP